MRDAAASGARATVLFQAFRFVLQMSGVVILARFIGPEGFGLYALAFAVVGIAEVVREFGIGSAVVQAKSVSRDESTNLFWLNTAIGFLIALVVAAGAPLLAHVFAEPRLEALVIALSPVFLLNGSSVQFTALLNRRMQLMRLGAIDVSGQAVGLALAIVLAVTGADYWALVAQVVLTALVSLALRLLFSGWRPGLPVRRVSLRRFLRYGVGMFGTRSLAYVAQNADTVALGMASSYTQVGYYSRAYQLAMVPINQINVPVTRVALPLLSKAFHERSSFEALLRRGQGVSLFGTVLIYSLAAGAAGPLIEVFLGPDWRPVAAIFAWLALAAIFRSFSQTPFWIFAATGRTGDQFRLNLLIQPLIVVSVVFAASSGARAVAFASAMAYGFAWFTGLFVACRVAKLDFAGLLRQSLGALLFVAAPAFLGTSGVVLLADFGGLLALLLSVSGGLVLSALVGCVVPFARREYAFLLKFAANALRKSR